MYDKAMEVLDQARDLIPNDRQSTYGNANDTARRIGMAWAAILGLGEPLPPYKVQAMMAALKLVRGVKDPNHEDSWVDGAAYMALAFECVDL